MRQFNVEHLDRFVVARVHVNRTIVNRPMLLGAMLNVVRDLGWEAMGGPPVDYVRRAAARFPQASGARRTRARGPEPL